MALPPLVDSVSTEPRWAALAQEAQEAVHRLHTLQGLGLVPRDGDFYPAVFYPPLRSYPRATADEAFRGWSPPPDGLFTFYAHIPFCYKTCTFCHIPVVSGASEAAKARYLDCVERELDLFMDRFDLSRIPVRSMSLAGGTPTAMSPALLERFLDLLRARLDLEPCTQIGMDLDPATVLGGAGRERLALLRQFGIQRLCYGVQSMRDDVLKAMNRAHDRAGAVRAVRSSIEAGFKVNIELIVGYPTDTFDSWMDQIDDAIQLGVDEMQLYRLKVIPYREGMGNISQLYHRQPELFPGPEDTLRMLRGAILRLRQAGYDETMRRFYTRTREDYSHYLMDQMVRHRDQIGFGQTAFSSLRDRFIQNTREVSGYQEALEAGRAPTEFGLVFDEETAVRRAFSMPLRFTWVDPGRFRAQTGHDLHSVFQPRLRLLMEQGLIEPFQGGYRQTDWGAFFAHEVAQQFHHPSVLPFPRQAYADGPLNPHVGNAVFG